ncbi:unnamed protein product [Caenorhabditis bovis]|uniref:Methyltransferase FkbM domain-containing protein n=1 Tax=Caenorhabditis bovis TaxID=2654633 RepID=A0A8S1EMH7_9PELO|nr:unnamed protein product [Caenorhabditis bovis]
MDDQISDTRISANDIDPWSPNAKEAWKEINEQNMKAEEDEEAANKFDLFAYKIDEATKICARTTNVWHLEADTIPNTVLKYVLADNPKETPINFVRVGIGANVAIENFFKEKVSPKSDFFGADPSYMVNAPLYESIGTFFPFAIGNSTGRTEAVVRIASDRKKTQTVDHIGIDTFFKRLVGKNVIDYLFFEGEGSEYDMMAHLGKNGTLEQAGIAICQMNIEYHRPKHLNDPRKRTFKKHVSKFIKDGKYVLLNVNNVGNLRLFWINVSSMVCVKRYLERLFANDVVF